MKIISYNCYNLCCTGVRTQIHVREMWVILLQLYALPTHTVAMTNFSYTTHFKQVAGAHSCYKIAISLSTLPFPVG
jgi:hypothetical protein